jgi:hypothetical protein
LSANGAAQPTKKELLIFATPLAIEKAKQEILCMTSIFLYDLGEPGTTRRLDYKHWADQLRARRE